MSCDRDVSMGLSSAKRGRLWAGLGVKGRRNMVASGDMHCCSRAEREYIGFRKLNIQGCCTKRSFV